MTPQFISHKAALCQVCLKITQWFWGRKRKCDKYHTEGQTDEQTEGPQVNIKARLSF